MSPGDPTPRTLVVPNPNLTGAIAALPTIHVLAREGHRTIVLTPGDVQALFKLVPAVEATVELVESEDRTVSDIRRQECTDGLLLDSSLDGPWLVLSAGLEPRWGYRGGLRRFFLKPSVPRPRDLPLQPAWYRPANLLSALGLCLPADQPPRLIPNEDHLSEGKNLLDRAHIADTGGPLVALAPISDSPTAPVWPWQSFAGLARTLRRRNPRVRQFLVAGARDYLWPAVRIHEETARFVPLIGPDLNLAQLASVLALADLVVGVESGYLQLAAALGVPCLALLGPREGARPEPPPGDGHTILRGKRGFSLLKLGRSLQLVGIEEEDVLKTVEEMLEL